MEPLSENKRVRQRAKEGYRRWFLNSFFDIILWYDRRGGGLTGFQFCFQKNKAERAFTWTSKYQSSHIVSDSSAEAGMGHLGSAILQGDGGTIPETVIERFKRESGDLDNDIKELIVSKIRAYNTRS